jgi:hypothetical protein
VRVRVGGCNRLGMEGAVQQCDAVADEDVGGVLGLGCLVEPGLGLLCRVERREGADRGGAGERQRLRLGGGVGRTGTAPPPRGRPRGPDRLYDEDALGAAVELVAGQVAAVGQRQRPGEVELRESE